MKLEKRRYDDIVILRFVGEFDTSNLPKFTERVEQMLQGGDIFYILDVHLLKFINSSALGFLIKFSKDVIAAGGELLIARPSKFLRKTLVTLGLESIFPIYESVEDAILHFKKGEDVGKLNLEGGAEYDESLTGAVPILFRFRDNEEVAPNQVGRIVTLYDDGLLFRYQPEGEVDPVEMTLRKDSILKLKFRQPFVVKDHYFEMDAKVSETNELQGATEDDRVLTVRVTYEDIGAEDRKHLEQFVRDQDSWRGDIGQK